MIPGINARRAERSQLLRRPVRDSQTAEGGGSGRTRERCVGEADQVGLGPVDAGMRLGR